MRVFLMEQEFEVWNSIVNGYIVPTTPPIDPNGKMIYDGHAKAMNATLSSLSRSKFIKFMHCDLAKDIWDKL